MKRGKTIFYLLLLALAWTFFAGGCRKHRPAAKPAVHADLPQINVDELSMQVPPLGGVHGRGVFIIPEPSERHLPARHGELERCNPINECIFRDREIHLIEK